MEVYNDIDDNPYYGFIPSYNKVKYHDNYDIIEVTKFSDEELFISDKYHDYLQNIVELCDKNNISLIINITPFIVQSNLSVYDAHRYINGLSEFFDEENIDVIDFSYNPSKYGIYLDDLHDDGHLNVGGAYKASVALGEILALEYGEVLVDSEYNFESETNLKLESFKQVLDKFYINKESILSCEI